MARVQKQVAPLQFIAFFGSLVMIMLLIAGLLVVFPAIVVVLWYIDRPMWMLPALVSFAINLLPFIVAILILRAMKRKGHDVEADAH
jgi:hypothetical protein